MCFNFFKKSKRNAVEPTIERPVETQIKVEEPSNYSFKLTVEDVTSAGRCKTVFDPSVYELEEAVNTLKYSDNNFIVFASKTPINNCTFIQATGYDSGDATVYSEIQRIESKDGKGIYRNYGSTIGIAQLKSQLVSFMQKVAPNIVSWDNMMEFDMD